MMIPRRLTFQLIVVAAVLSLALPNFAEKKKPAGPRAIGVLEWTGKGLRLVPISLMIDGRYYDANLYRANPIPMALDEGNVYEVQRAGEAVGDFTVMVAAQNPTGGWIGEGNWISNEERKRKEEQRAKAKSAASAAAAAPPKDERPVLRRGGNKPEPAPPASSPAPATPPPAAAPPTPAPVLTETSSDPNRPILRRSNTSGGNEQSQKLGNENVQTKTPTNPPTGLNKTQVAVSDANTAAARPYVWKWASQDEETKLRRQIEKIALNELNAYAAKINGPRPGRVEDIEVHAFDLAYNNSPDIVFSARVLPATQSPARKTGAKTTTTAAPTPPAPSDFEYYVTVVAREDIYAELNKSFSAVTDNHHLDAYPRLQVIDAVDGDGNGSGDLLFRGINDAGSSFVLFKVWPSRLDELLRVPEPKL
jgi:hypothetical protein